MKIVSKVCFSLCRPVGVVLLLLFGSSSVEAQTFNFTEDLSDYGTLSQYNSGVTLVNPSSIQPVACAPTAFIDALTFLNNVNNGDVYTLDPATYSSVNAMAVDMNTTSFYVNNVNQGGTTYYHSALGSISYGLSIPGQNPGLFPRGYNPTETPVTIGGQFAIAGGAGRGLGAKFNSTIPTASYLAAGLQSNSAVELAIAWGTVSGGTFTPSKGGPSHVVDLYSLNLQNGTGSAGVVDPASEKGLLNDPNATAQNFSATVSTVNLNGSNWLYLTYPTPPFSGSPAEAETAAPICSGLRTEKRRW